MRLVLAGLVLLTSPAVALEVTEADRALAREALIVDTHIDVPYRLQNRWEDVTKATEKGQFDAPRAHAGGLDIPFMSIYTPPSLETEGGSRELALRLVDSMEALVGRDPDQFTMVSSPEQARAAQAAGKIGLALGMENGSPLEGDLANIALFRDRGISYITLAHSKANHISDSSYDEERPNGGLSDFGKEVVREMNRLGVMVDISHVSDDAFWQALEISSVPLMASHSSARHFTPDFERNMSDEMIVALAKAGGVIMINFGSSFLTAEARAWRDAFGEAETAWLEANGFADDAPEAKQFAKDYRVQHPYPFANVDETVAHFEHVIDLVGVAHVGIGSDYDGVGDSLPEGLKDVASFPTLVAAFRERGYSRQQIEAILGGNLMRVWQQVLDGAQAGS